ncbi:uncharacterized protein LOC131425641 [Malaya genurostris]|uniref:uncharacterized protein LOC131425641 n=1 Tax=Malaya genurostris TaxID=325434 RepID=UPI0026F4068F|nr:uncharacterized protein LOC131425641 [Malaya genurostris]
MKTNSFHFLKVSGIEYSLPLLEPESSFRHVTGSKVVQSCSLIETNTSLIRRTNDDLLSEVVNKNISYCQLSPTVVSTNSEYTHNVKTTEQTKAQNYLTEYSHASETISTVTDSEGNSHDDLLSDGTDRVIATGRSSDEIKRKQRQSVSSLCKQSSSVTQSSHASNIFSTKILEKLLNSSEEGKDILKCAIKTELSEAKQLELSSIIAKHHINSKNKLLTEDLRTYALAVTSLFKFERSENYFIPRDGDRKNHGGKIANKIGNLKQRKRKRETKENEYQVTKRTLIDPQNKQNEDAEDAAEWLKLNSEPWTVVLDQWKISYAVRKRDLLSRKRIPHLFKTYPQYKLQHGFQLIDIDFQKSFPESKNGLMQLPYLIPRIAAYISKKACDPSAVYLLERLTDDDANNDKKICALLLALNTVLSPISVASRFEPTILVGQEDTLIFVGSKEQAQLKIQEIYQSYAELNIPIVPKLFAVGESLDNLQGTFIVGYDDLCYEFPSILRAVDVLIKLTAVLGLPFSKISKLVWHFLSSYIYGLKQRETYASIIKLKTYLEPNINE